MIYKFKRLCGAFIEWNCDDVLRPSSVCRQYMVDGLCNTASVKRLCQLTCNLCGMYVI